MKMRYPHQHISASAQAYLVGAITIPILQMKSLRHGEFRDLIRKKQGQSGASGTKFKGFTHKLIK